MVKLVFSNFISSLLFQLLITISCAIAQLLFDADKLVVLSHTVGTAHRTRLNLTRVCCYGNISNCCILGFTRTMGSNGGVTMTVSHLDSIQCLGKRTNLVHLDEDRVGSTHLDALFQELHVGNKEVVTYQLTTVADGSGQLHPVVPIVLVKAILNRIDRIFGNQFFQELDLLSSSQFLPLGSFFLPSFNWR